MDPDLGPLEAKALTDRLRVEGHEVLTDPDGTYVEFLRAADAEHLLKNRDFGAAVAMGVLALSGVTAGPLHDLWSQLMFGKDGEEHARLRRPVAGRFTPRAVEGLRPDVERFSAEALSAIDPHLTVDLWSAYAVPLPARAACALAGIPDEDAVHVADLALEVVRAFGLMPEPVVETTERSAAALVALVDRLVDDGRAVPGSILDDLLHADDHDLTRPEVVALTANLVFGGLDATAKAILTSLLALHTHPHAWDAVVADPGGAAPGAVAECLRFTPPLATIARMPFEDTELAGTPVCAFQPALANIDSISRDPDLYDRSDEFDIERAPGRQYAFGAGVHHCLGANLARLVLTVSVRDLAARFPRLRIAADPADLPWEADPFRGPVSMPVVLDPPG